MEGDRQVWEGGGVNVSPVLVELLRSNLEIHGAFNPSKGRVPEKQSIVLPSNSGVLRLNVRLEKVENVLKPSPSTQCVNPPVNPEA